LGRLGSGPNYPQLFYLLAVFFSKVILMADDKKPEKRTKIIEFYEDTYKDSEGKTYSKYSWISHVNQDANLVKFLRHVADDMEKDVSKP